VDGLPEHHDTRRKPATYDRILRNIAGCHVNIHWTITAPMMQRAGYLEEYVAFWDARAEVNRILVSYYSPQQNEHSPEVLSPSERHAAGETLKTLRARYPKLLMNSGIARAMEFPPAAPGECMFSKLSTNYSADLQTRVEPCIFGGSPDCSRCGCSISSGLHWLKTIKLAGLIKIETIVDYSVKLGSRLGKLRRKYSAHPRWTIPPAPERGLVQIAKHTRLQ
jgi:hypothetical protein